MTDLVIVIPARGGSVGAPRKNLQVVGGHTLIARAVMTALHAGVGDVIVSTDDPEIGDTATEAARRYVRSGVRFLVRYRPAELATSTASSESALIDVLQWGDLPATASAQYTHAILMQCTSPFTLRDDVRAVAEVLRSGEACALSVTPFFGFVWGKPRHPIDHDPSRPRERRQDRGARYVENGALYGMRVADLLATGNRFTSPAPYLYVMPAERSLEIDDPYDLHVAQKVDGWPG